MCSILTDPTGFAISEYIPVYGNVLDFQEAVRDGRFGAAAAFGTLAVVDGVTLGVGPLVTAPLKALTEGAIKAEIKKEAAFQIGKEGAEQAAKASTNAVKSAEQTAAKMSEKSVGEGAAAAESKGAATASERAKNPSAKRGPKTHPDAPHNKMVRESAENELAENPGSKIVAGGGQKAEKLVETLDGIKEGHRPDTIIEKADGS